MSILKNLWKGNNKHKKLPDEWDLAANQDFDGDDFTSTGSSSYKVKYLGHIPVDGNDNTTDTTANAIEAIISMSKANRKLIQKVMVSVNLKGIEISDRANEKAIMDISIFRIRNCLAYAKNRRIFAFLATDSQETTECHAFLCSKRSMAENMAVTVAQTFTAVFQMWQTARRGSIGTMYYGKSPLLPSYSKFEMEHSTFKENVPLSSLSNKWISFDDSLKDASSDSTRSMVFAEVYVSPPAYSEKPFSESQLTKSNEWASPSPATAELIVL
ncbi:low density lipoprotein receptor adapter protein 1-B-like [Macrosteles quadrilineatus]|uniref:low density lipoprotein receptor adapter protein 1-B-like n=1 Tax=Macrosteles quadrilineatus TaxID=74068 RepID=UPI0023E317F1|nr:low density lipoprotein receptor adapter protein 1-B-like [Macrosteles quadrilineatus]